MNRPGDGIRIVMGQRRIRPCSSREIYLHAHTRKSTQSHVLIEYFSLRHYTLLFRYIGIIESD